MKWNEKACGAVVDAPGLVYEILQGVGGVTATTGPASLPRDPTSTPAVPLAMARPRVNWMFGVIMVPWTVKVVPGNPDTLVPPAGPGALSLRTEY